MGMIEHPIASNPLRTKADLALAFQQLVKPLLPRYSEGRARLQLTGSGAGYSSDVAEMEGFSRILWGLVPFLAGGGEDESFTQLIVQGIDNGTNPEHPEYWGKVNDYDQRLVEMASMGFSLAIVPEQIWGRLSNESQQRFYAWLSQINQHPAYDCNWLFFQVLVNIGFRKLGLPVDEARTEANLQRIEQFYLEEGWYADGIGGHSDYYVPFAIQYYALLYAKLMKAEDSQRAERFQQRAGQFAEQFIHWFAGEGQAIPYGRSMAYRYSQGAFWGAMAFAEDGTYSYGVLKGLFLRHLRWWFQQPIFASDGIMTVGYAYPNLIMAENYNAPGSVYWAMKAFLPLALPDDHPFWQAEEEVLPALPSVSVQRAPHMVVVHSAQTGHTAAFNTGHLGSNEHTHTSAKYEKFAYSASFGFSVPRAEWGLSQGAFDSMLALSEGDNIYRVRRKNEEASILDSGVLKSTWHPWRDVKVTTWIVPGLPWHLRVHHVETARELDAAEGGFALPIDGALTELRGGAGAGNGNEAGNQSGSETTAAIGGRSGFGVCGIAGVAGYDEAALVHAQSNTNLMHPRTAIPTLKAKLAPGVHWLVSAVYGETGAADAGFELASWQKSIRVRIEPGAIQIDGPQGQRVTIER